MLNDAGFGDFDTELEDEEIFDAHSPPGYEIGRLEIEPDNGSGSFAQDGRLEVAEDEVMDNGESQLGSAAMYGPTEIGAGLASEEGQSEIGENVLNYQYEIGAAPAADRPGSEIGAGLFPEDGAAEIGRANDIMAPFESFMLEDEHMGAASAADRPGSEIGAGLYPADGASEIGAGLYPLDGASEIGADVAVAKVVEKARDNRQPPPPMQAVEADAPIRDDLAAWALTDTFIGAAAKTGSADPYPLLSKLLLRAGAATEPRFVRVDTEESYRQFRRENSPELAEIADKLDRHIHDPDAHDLSSELDDGLTEDVEELVHLGAKLAEEKRIELWMPKRFEGKLEAWQEGDFVCASLALPGKNGEVRICTSWEPIKKCVSEMARHASEADVPAHTVVGVLPAMGCVLGAGTIVKEVAAAAPSILARKENDYAEPFVVRIEPKMTPSIAALGMLFVECRNGNAQALAELKKLSESAPGVVKQAMNEAMQLVKASA